MKTHNIGLQRTSACGLAAEAGSFGGLIRLVCGMVAVLLTATIALGQATQDERMPRESRIAMVSLSPGMCVGDCESWSIELMRDGSAMVTIWRTRLAPLRAGAPVDATGMRTDRYHVAAGSSSVRDLTTLVEGLDPSIPPLTILMDAASFGVACEPPGSLNVVHALESDGVGSPMYRIRERAAWIVGYVENGFGGAIP